MEIPHTLAIVAGSGTYPHAMVRGARMAGVQRIVAAAFQDETDPALADAVDLTEWMRVGQLGKMLAFLKASGARHAVMSGQIAPKNLFNLRPDIKAVLLLAKLVLRRALRWRRTTGVAASGIQARSRGIGATRLSTSRTTTARLRHVCRRT